MKASREILEDRLENFEEELKGLNSFVKELKAMTTKHGTDPAQVEDDLREAEHNIKFYEAEIAGLKKELGESAQPGGTRPYVATAPAMAGKGITSIIFSSVGFIFGAILGSRFKSGKDK